MIAKTYYTRNTPLNRPNIAYVYTEHINGIGTTRPGGGTSIIRGHSNALPIVTKKSYIYQENRTSLNKELWNENFKDTENDFLIFKALNSLLFDKIDQYDKIVFPEGFATGLARLPLRFLEWLQLKLKERFGLITEINNGLKSIKHEN